MSGEDNDSTRDHFLMAYTPLAKGSRIRKSLILAYFLISITVGIYILMLFTLSRYTRRIRPHLNPRNCNASMEVMWSQISDYSRLNHGKLSRKKGVNGISEMLVLDTLCLCNGSTRDLPSSCSDESGFDFVYNWNIADDSNQPAPLVWDKPGNHVNYTRVLYSDGTIDTVDWRLSIRWLKEYRLADYYLKERRL